MIVVLASDNPDAVYDVGSAFPNGWVFTRASTGTKVGAIATINLASTNEARFEKNPATGTTRGLLYETSSTNLTKYSSNPSASTFRTDFVTSTAYYRGGCTAAVSTEITPLYSGAEIIKVTEDTTNTAHFLCSPSAASPASSEDRVFSVALYAGTCSKVALTPKSGFLTADDYNVKFNLATGTVINAKNLTSYGIVDYGNGWFIPWIVYNTSTSTSFRSVTVQTVSDASAVSFTGTSRTFYMSMPQCETGTSPSSYMPSDANNFTRSADSLVIPLIYPKNNIIITFDDGTTQTITGLTGPTYTLTTSINRKWVRRVTVRAA